MLCLVIMMQILWTEDYAYVVVFFCVTLQHMLAQCSVWYHLLLTTVLSCFVTLLDSTPAQQYCTVLYSTVITGWTPQFAHPGRDGLCMPLSFSTSEDSMRHARTVL